MGWMKPRTTKGLLEDPGAEEIRRRYLSTDEGERGDGSRREKEAGKEKIDGCGNEESADEKLSQAEGGCTRICWMCVDYEESPWDVCDRARSPPHEEDGHMCRRCRQVRGRATTVG